MDNTTKMLSDIRERVVRVETKIDSMSDVRVVADKAKADATEALQSARSAHHRLNSHAKVIFWAGTTIIGAVIIGALNFFMR